MMMTMAWVGRPRARSVALAHGAALAASHRTDGNRYNHARVDLGRIDSGRGGRVARGVAELSWENFGRAVVGGGWTGGFVVCVVREIFF